MMRGRMEPSIVPIVVKAVPPMVQTVKQTIIVPQMTFPQDKKPRE
jgi:hypothetical protein